MSIELAMPSTHLILCHPLLLLTSVFPSIRVGFLFFCFFFPSDSALHIKWPKYWSFSFSINLPMNIQGWFPWGLTGLILQSKGLSRVFLQNHNSKALILQLSDFFMVQLSYLYMTTGKTIVLTILTLSTKWCLCFFNMLSWVSHTFLSMSKCLNFMTAVTVCSDFGASYIKSVTVSTFSPSICHEWGDQKPWS